MKKIILFLGFILMTGIIFAQDTLAVQTLTFDSIATRRAVFEFPDDPNAYRKILMVYSLKCDPATTADGFNCGEWDYLTYNDIFVHTGQLDTAGNEIIERYEIGRFITPYGINLNLDTHGHNPGPNGFTWVYDVTDYAPLLTGMVDMRAGNNQELIDVTFLFISGTPVREVKQIDRIWGSRSTVSYKALDEDTRLNSTTLSLHSEASNFKVISRLSGHGHNSNDGSFPHCCEWKDNTHYFHINGQQVDSWHIWQTNDCAANAVFPQGGTWPGAREGWCPGDRVKDHEIDITSYVDGDEVTLDYSITPVPLGNPGMGNGNYRVATQLIQYGDYAYSNDIELYDIVKPSRKDEYARFNPVCNEAEVIIRNSGANTLTSCTIEYGVKGGPMETLQWTGSLQPMEKTNVVLPFAHEAYLVGDGANRFVSRVEAPNAATDENAENNEMEVSFPTPDVVSGVNTLLFIFNTNNRAHENGYTLRDMAGNVLINRTVFLLNNVTYEDEVTLEDGKCYTVEMYDNENDGLSYWADPNAGNGSFLIKRKITSTGGPTFKSFESEFGHSIHYTFSMGTITDVDQTPEIAEAIGLYPLPASNYLNVDISDLYFDGSLSVFDALGRPVYVQEVDKSDQIQLKIRTAEWPNGHYVLKIETDGGFVTKKFVKQ